MQLHPPENLATNKIRSNPGLRVERPATNRLSHGMGLKTNDRERKKEVKSRGLVTDTFMLGGKRGHHLILGSQASSARPSDRSSIKIKYRNKNVRMMTVVA